MPQNPPKPSARIIPFLYADDVAAYLAFLASAFGFETKRHEVDPGDPEHEHAETSLGGAFVMISHASPKFGSASPRSLPARHSSNYVYVEDVDAHFRHAQAAGATIEGQPADMPWADRMYTARDPEGHQWHFATPALPNLADVFARILTKVADRDRPLVVAIAERMAAERYRGWASEVTHSADAAHLLACAQREEEIAARVEALFSGASAIQRQILEKHPDLADLNRSLFADRPLHVQFRIQAQGERLGAATWRSFASREKAGAARETFLACAELEETSAVVLESML
ncbi:MAG: VOC family protein [Proteobacteria bacterium]|nr:VOC family protein [Pseudomonadota bacterium]